MRWGRMIKYSVLTVMTRQVVNNYLLISMYECRNKSFRVISPAMDASIKDKLSYYPGFAALSYVDGSFFSKKYNVGIYYALINWLKIGIGQTPCVWNDFTNPFVIAKSHLLKDYGRK